MEKDNKTVLNSQPKVVETLPKSNVITPGETKARDTKTRTRGDKDKDKGNKKVLKLQGKVIEVLPGTKFKVAIDHKSGSHVIIGYISGKMRMYYIKLQKGDVVDLEVSPYDLTKGRITYRYK